MSIVRSHQPRGWVTLVGPLALPVLAYVLWWISDRLVYIGPIDRATFGWAVVVPLWLLAPVAAAAFWDRLPEDRTRWAASFLWAVIALAVAVLFWQAVAAPDCPTGPRTTRIGWVVPSILIGALVGGGPAIGALMASRPWREGQRWRAVVAGVLPNAITGVIVLLAVTWTIVSNAGCNRP